MINRSDIEKVISGRILVNEPMSRHTTFRIGGPCDFFVEIKNQAELTGLLELALGNKVPYFIIGCGSNILVKDKGIRGIVIRLAGDFCKVEFNNESVVSGGGCAIQYFIKRCADNGLGGMEFLAGIPGTIGGAVKMNAGTKTGSIDSILKTVKIMDGNGTIKQVARGEIEFSYRHSGIPENSIVVLAEFGLKRTEKNDIIKNLTELINFRTKTQPVGFQNAGCVFRNPPGDFAAMLIDKAGLKGTKIGGAVVSDIHANYINNTGDASADDVLKLIQIIKSTVKEKFSKELELEIKIVG